MVVLFKALIILFFQNINLVILYWGRGRIKKFLILFNWKHCSAVINILYYICIKENGKFLFVRFFLFSLKSVEVADFGLFLVGVFFGCCVFF